MPGFRPAQSEHRALPTSARFGDVSYKRNNDHFLEWEVGGESRCRFRYDRPQH